ncbi:hypothetical protein ASE63_18990 [Bosea sp. Root381]|uniref:transglutaminase family protein n=1 Tax=Bosea sp. Root381 TaxID=1736524 RepID=UPI00070137A2|nr:transglutaminase family protein [Bosea sp. Root381]KRE11842.1 hypothetical protein ASE63_18990 [Bosea sp. Root381]
MRLRIRHSTTYRYAVPVMFGPHRLMLRPRDSFDLRVLDTALSISPTAQLRWMHDAYGNSVAVAHFDAPADTLDIISELVIERFDSALPNTEIKSAAGITGVVYSAGEQAVLQPYLCLAAADPDGVLDQWLADFRARIGQGSGHLLRDLAHALHAGLGYAVRYDEGTQHPVDTLGLRAGSCRDYAWLFIELARRMGFAARFVTGYIHDRTPDAAGLISTVGLTHAWAEVFIPGDGWVEFDPTNDLVADRQLLRVAVARVPEDASPVAGSFTGPDGSFLGLGVGVTIEPVEAPPGDRG